MPDVIIKGMEMPENCQECPVMKQGVYFRWCGIDQPGCSDNVDDYIDSRPDWCPLSLAPESENAENSSGVEMNIFDKEEIHPNCTVQILTNTQTGEQSVGWWENPTEPGKDGSEW